MSQRKVAKLVEKTLLKKLGFRTCYAAARAIGMDSKQLSQILKGQVSPTIRTLERIFDAVNYDVVVNFEFRRRNQDAKSYE